MHSRYRRSLVALLAAIASAATVLPAIVFAAGSWSAADSLNYARTSFAAATLSDGSVLVAGGSPGSVVGARAELYDAGADNWAVTGNLNIRRAGHSLSALEDGRALAVGGNSAAGIQASAELYDTTSGTWALTSPLATPRLNHTATVLADGRVLVAGGLANSGGATNEVEIYDPDTDTWTRADSLHNPRYNHTATLMADGRVLVAGGFTPGKFHTPTRTTEVYDPLADRWSVAGMLQVERAVHAAVLLADGKVLVAGGVAQPPNTLTVTPSAELFDPATERWTATGSLALPRRAIQGVLLNDGSVLVAGGFDDNNSLTASVELYDPLTGTWSAGPSMAVARAPWLARLDDGAVLAIASVGRLSTTVVELFQP